MKKVNFNILTQEDVKRISRNETNIALNYLEREISKLRLKVIDLEKVIDSRNKKLNLGNRK